MPCRGRFREIKSKTRLVRLKRTVKFSWTVEGSVEFEIERAYQGRKTDISKSS